MTKAIMDGRLYLDEEPPQYLEEMDNPYDFNQREYLQVRHKDQPEYKWDYAYYDGKYYIYFGILSSIIDVSTDLCVDGNYAQNRPGGGNTEYSADRSQFLAGA